MMPRIYLVRHGETEWSRSGRHTGASDIPLTPAGADQARAIGRWLARRSPAEVWCSPLRRARQTADAAGFSPERLNIEPALSEWNYGEYEGITTAEIQSRRPGWNVFEHGCPAGESPDDVARRADEMLSRLRASAASFAMRTPTGDHTGGIAVFSHGHFLRVLAARWIRLPAATGAKLLLGTATVSILACEHDNPDEPALALWNAPPCEVDTSRGSPTSSR